MGFRHANSHLIYELSFAQQSQKRVLLTEFELGKLRPWNWCGCQQKSLWTDISDHEAEMK